MREVEGLIATLPPCPASAGVARELVAWQLRDWHEECLCEDAALVVTELVTNAIRYARTDFEVRMKHILGGVRLEVRDGSAMTLRPRQAASTDETGRGLQLVGAICDRYGVEGDADGKRVWAELLTA